MLAQHSPGSYLKTYGQHNIHKIHNRQNDDSHAHVVVPIREEQEGNCEDVMREHLGVVLALLLNIDDQNLRDPESPLHQVVPLEDAVNFAKGPALPDAVEVQPKLRVVHDVLSAY